MRKKMARLICALITVCMIAVCFLPAQQVSAAGDTLTIYVAYFGQSYAQPIQKATFTRSQLEAMGAHSAFYTAVDKGGFCACSDVYGVDLGTVLSAAGVNYWSASSLNFRTADKPGGYTTLSVGYLFGSRFAYPELPLYYGTPEGELERRFADPANPDIPQEEIIAMLSANRVAVPTMLAFTENYGRAADFSAFDGGAMGGDSAFRLFIGQTAPNEAVSSNLASWVEGIVVLFPGPPVLSTDKTDLALEIGEDYKVSVNVGDSDPLLMADVLSKLKWESSNGSVVSVDQDGQLTVHGQGTATITVYAEDYYDSNGNKVSLSITINAGTGENLGGGGEGTGSGDGEGSGSGEGEGTGDGEGSGDDDQPSVGGNGDKTDQEESGGESGGEPEDSTAPTGATEPNPTEPDPTEPESTEPDPTDAAPTEPEGEDPTEAPTEAPTEPQEDSKTPESPDPDDPDEPEELYVSDDQSSTQLDTQKEKPKGLQVRKLVLSGSGAQESSAGSEAKESGYEGGSEAMLLVEENPLMIFTIVMAIVLFLCGGAGKYLIFKREL